VKDRVFGLDLMRFVAIMLVVVGHGSSLIQSIPEASRIVSYVDFLGVEIFFVLSGFLIGSILINLFEKENIGIGVIRNFWARRWWRTMPNYFLFLLVNYIGFLLLKPDFNFDWKFLVFSQNLYYLPENFFSVSWSLAVEEWFYLLIPLIVWLFFAGIPNLKYSFLISVIFFIAIATIYRFFYIYFSDPHWNEELRRVVVFRLDSLIYGVVGAIFKFYWPKVFQRMKYVGLNLGVFLLVFAIFLRFDEGLNDSILKRTVLFPIISIAFLFCLPWLSSLKNVGEGFFTKIITNVSIWSYSLYLIHVPLMDALSYVFKGYLGKGVFFDVFVFLFWIGFSIVLSMVNYIYFEKPFTNFRDIRWSSVVMRRAA